MLAPYLQARLDAEELVALIHRAEGEQCVVTFRLVVVYCRAYTIGILKGIIVETTVFHNVFQGRHTAHRTFGTCRVVFRTGRAAFLESQQITREGLCAGTLHLNVAVIHLLGSVQHLFDFHIHHGGRGVTDAVEVVVDTADVTDVDRSLR